MGYFLQALAGTLRTGYTKKPGINSPFAQRVIQEVLFDTKKYGAYGRMLAARQRYLHSQQQVRVEDSGAGHRRGKTKEWRKVSDIVKRSSAPLKYHRLLYRATRYFKPDITLEAGTSLGLGTLALALGNPEGRVFTVEGDPASARLARQLFEQQHLPNITLLNGTFREMFPKVFQQTHRLDLVFLDGHHEEEPTLEYFGAFLPRFHEKSILVMDDIYWSRGMFRAWNTVRHHPSVSLSIDLFRMGILFFDPELPQQTVRMRF